MVILNRNISHLYCFYCIFDQINAVLVIRRTCGKMISNTFEINSAEILLLLK